MRDFEQRVLERMPSSEEERASLGRVWNQVERAGGRIPDDVLRSVQQRSPSRHQRAWTFLPKAVAAMLVLGAAIGTAIVWPSGVRVYAAGNDGLQVTLSDDSRVEMRAHAEMTVGRASDGIQIDLKTGDIIVTAARQRNGHLYVRTKDMIVAVEGTVLLANAGQQGSRVGVIEGEVRVREGDRETRLRPGEQVASSPRIVSRPLENDITWSRDANAHLSILESFRRGIARTAGTLTPVSTPGQAAVARGQAASIEFEEASIRECDPDNLPAPPSGARGGGANSLQMTPGRLYALCLSPATLIRTALGYEPGNFFGTGGRAMKSGIVYGLGVEDGLRVRGGPDWVRNEFYTVEAVAGGSADAETMRGPMLRALLERRFGLKTHTETEALPAFALTVAPGGHKMREGLCDGPQLGPAPAPAEVVRKNLDVVRRGATPSAPCGVGGVPNGPNILFVSAGAGLPPLRDILGVPVINRTDFPQSARYSYVLEFQPDERTPGARRGYSRIDHDAQLAANPASVPPAPDIVTALERQLGLRLEPARQPREYIVIDAIQRPSAN